MGIESFSLSDGNRFGKNAIIFSANMSSSMHDDNKKKYFNSYYRSNAMARQSYVDCRKKKHSINFTK